MHPARSIIAFTIAAGAGYGVLILLIAGRLAGSLFTEQPALLASAAALWFALTSGGLLASSLHLGRPERALLGLSQWRTSWLSREAIAALACYPLGLGYVLWSGLAANADGAGRLALGVITILICLVTLWCTGMIYASLRPIFAWHTRLVPLSYVCFGLLTGALLLALVAHAGGSGAANALQGLAAGFSLPGLGLKVRFWHRLDRGGTDGGAAEATGLGPRGTVRVFEDPHSGESYVMREMGYRIARRHAPALRRAALTFAFGLPFLLSLVASLLPASAALALASLAALTGAFGMVIERWLFFAEAKHVVSNYYTAGSE
jgi:DMSO reductase anchor subunit